MVIGSGKPLFNDQSCIFQRRLEFNESGGSVFSKANTLKFAPNQVPHYNILYGGEN